jgi:uncharacterized LabA/DUF88 family protein
MNNSYPLNRKERQARKIQSNTCKLRTSERSLAIAEKITIIGTVLGGLTTVVSGQIIHGFVPFSLSLIINERVNRRRLELNQEKFQTTQIQTVQTLNNTLESLASCVEKIQLDQIKSDERVSQSLNSNKKRLEELEQSVNGIEFDSQRILTKTHLTPVISQVQKIQRQYKILELREIGGLAKQVEKLQKQIETIDNNIVTFQTSNSVQKEQPSREANSKSGLLPRKKIPIRDKNDRVTIFIDASNLYHSAVEQKVNIDYSLLLTTLKAESKQCQVFFYTGINPHDEKQKQFICYLRRKGFQIVSKKIVTRADGSCKANMDVELALDLIDLSHSYDTAILVSGDGDFQDAIKRLQSRGKRVEVASFGCNTSRNLIEVADSFLDLKLIYPEIKQSKERELIYQ